MVTFCLCVECTKQVPLVFCIMSGRRKHNYKKVRHRFVETCLYRANILRLFNPSMNTGNYSATSNNMKLVHWPLTGGLLQLVQRWGDWAGPQPTQVVLAAVPNVIAHPSAASEPITVLLYTGPLLCCLNVPIKGLKKNSHTSAIDVSTYKSINFEIVDVRSTLVTPECSVSLTKIKKL